MDREAALTVGIVAFVAGSAAFFVVLIGVGAFTNDLGWPRFAIALVPGLAAAGGAGYTVATRANPEQLAGRRPGEE